MLDFFRSGSDASQIVFEYFSVDELALLSHAADKDLENVLRICFTDPKGSDAPLHTKPALKEKIPDFKKRLDYITQLWLEALKERRVRLIVSSDGKDCLFSTLEELRRSKDCLEKRVDLTPKERNELRLEAPFDSPSSVATLNNTMDAIISRIVKDHLRPNPLFPKTIQINLDLPYLSKRALSAIKQHSPALESLNLSDNKIRYLPDGLFSGFRTLTSVNVSNNVLVRLPTLGSDESRITKLSLGKNQLTMLHDSLFDLPLLTNLDISDNQFKTFDARLGDLTLSRLRIAGNPIKKLPPELRDLFEATNNLDNYRHFFRATSQTETTLLPVRAHPSTTLLPGFQRLTLGSATPDKQEQSLETSKKENRKHSASRL